jgi:VWFA-related protein
VTPVTEEAVLGARMRLARHLVLICLSTAFVACSVKAQTTGGLIKRTPESAEQARRLERRVTLDVRVTDGSGKAVSGLGQQDFTLFDNGHPQTVTSFREIGGSNVPAPTEAILLLDTMNASLEDVVIERQGIDKFLRQNGGHLALPVSIVFLADTGVKLNKASQDGNSLAEDLKKLQTPMRVLGSAQGADGAQDRSQRSLRAMRLLSTYEAARPGRKLLIWVGPGWPLLSRSTAELSAQDQRRYFDSIVDTTTALRRAHITLYSVAPLNLAQVSGQNPFLYKTYLKGVENPAQADSPNLALQVLALHSGGLVLDKSGDLAGQISLCIADAQSYYEISFDAGEAATSPQYRALQVKLDRMGAQARTNSAYYAGVPENTAGVPPSTSALPTAPAVPVPRVLQTEARLVLEDVTVLDKEGLPVKGLSSADFVLREDNTPQKIVSVEEHSAVGDAIAAAPTVGYKDGTIVASNKPPEGSVWNVLLIDLYNTPNEARGRLQSQLEQFLKQLPEHQPVAVVTMLSHIKIETSFQDGAAAAYQYLRKNGLGPVDPSTPANIVERQEPDMPSADLAGTVIPHQANTDVDRQASRAQTTMDCFSALAQWLAPYPGRKNVYWLSGGFPLQGQPFGVAGYSLNRPDLGPDTKGGHPIPMQQKTDKELETARVAIYPVDARGVAAPDIAGVTSADTTYTANVAIVSEKDADLSAGQRQEMLEIAKATGGTARFSNNITQALRDDFNQANTYYTIAYTPPDKEWQGAYHRIQVAVGEPEAQLAYREGYYARSAEAEAKPTPEEFRDALRLGAPSEQAVQFTSQITKSGESATVEYGVEPKTVNFEEDASGQFLTDIDFAILEYDAKGKVLDKSAIRLSGKMTPEQRANLSSKTLTAKQTITLKVGAANLVLGVRDRVSGRFGRVEVPLEKP